MNCHRTVFDWSTYNRKTDKWLAARNWEVSHFMLMLAIAIKLTSDLCLPAIYLPCTALCGVISGKITSLKYTFQVVL